MLNYHKESRRKQLYSDLFAYIGEVSTPEPGSKTNAMNLGEELLLKLKERCLLSEMMRRGNCP